MLCDRSYKRRWKLQQHYRVEHSEKQRPADHSEAVQSETSNDASDSKPTTNVSNVMFADRLGDSYPSLPPSALPHDANTGPSVGGPGHSCNVCGQTFGLKQSLKVHLLTHARVIESILSKLMPSNSCFGCKRPNCSLQIFQFI